VTETLLAVGLPVATLLNVHSLAVVSHAVVVVVRTNCEVLPTVANETVAVSPVPPVQATVGVEERKKYCGKLMVIWFAPAAAYAVASLNPTVTTAVPETAPTFAPRCAAVIANVTPVTWPPKGPVSTGVLGKSSVD